jgi:cell division protein ZapE
VPVHDPLSAHRDAADVVRGLAALGDPPSPGAGLDGFVPPPRFGTTRFADYLPDHPSQKAARDEVARFAAEAVVRARPARLRLPWRRPPEGRGLYLDGGFGVGKTHLLAAAWHAAPLPARRKRYLSFQELAYLLGVLGREGARDAFADVALVCLDEFELDDPGNTLIIATFLREAFARGTAVLTTSNTPPESQGAGRFAAEDFRREIQGIAGRFTVVAIDGPDHRAGLRRVGWTPADALAAAEREARGRVVTTSGAELDATLARLHPIRYRGLLARVDVLLVEDVRPMADQNAALRFVHFVDKLYDLGVRLRVSGSGPMEAVFDASYREGAYAKKHHRCLSRLSELLQEPLAPTPAAGG